MPRTFSEQDIIKLVHQAGATADLLDLLAESKPERAENIWKLLLQRVPNAILNKHLLEIEEDEAILMRKDKDG